MENMMYFGDFAFSYDPDLQEIKSYDYKVIEGFDALNNEGILTSISATLAKEIEEFYEISLEDIGIEILEDELCMQD